LGEPGFPSEQVRPGAERAGVIERELGDAPSGCGDFESARLERKKDSKKRRKEIVVRRGRLTPEALKSVT